MTNESELPRLHAIDDDRSALLAHFARLLEEALKAPPPDQPGLERIRHFDQPDEPTAYQRSIADRKAALAHLMDQYEFLCNHVFADPEEERRRRAAIDFALRTSFAFQPLRPTPKLLAPETRRVRVR